MEADVDRANGNSARPDVLSGHPPVTPPGLDGHPPVPPPGLEGHPPGLRQHPPGAPGVPPPGGLMSRVITATTLLRDAIASSFVGLATGTLTLVATLVVMGILDWLLLLVSLAAVVGATVLIGVVAPRVQKATLHAQQFIG